MRLFAGTKARRWLKTLPARMSSAAMILENNDGQVLIVKANYKTYWTFPGGIIDPGETPKEGAVRETYEEIGVAIDPDQIEFFAVVNRRSSVASTYQFIFRAAFESDMLNKIVLQVSEIDEYAWVTREEVATHDRTYGKVIEHWAAKRTGYIEQTFGGGNDA